MNKERKCILSNVFNVNKKPTVIILLGMQTQPPHSEMHMITQDILGCKTQTGRSMGGEWYRLFVNKGELLLWPMGAKIARALIGNSK